LGQGEDGFGSLGEFVDDEGVGAAEFVFDFAGLKDVPTLKRDPVGLGEIGGRGDAFELEEFVKALGAAVKPEDAEAGAVHVGHGEHFAANVAVAGPVDEVMSPVEGFGNVRQGHADGADAFVVHGIPVYGVIGDPAIVHPPKQSLDGAPTSSHPSGAG